MFISHKTCIGLIYEFLSLEELELQTNQKKKKRQKNCREREKKNVLTDVFTTK